MRSSSKSKTLRYHLPELKKRKLMGVITHPEAGSVVIPSCLTCYLVLRGFVTEEICGLLVYHQALWIPIGVS